MKMGKKESDATKNLELSPGEISLTGGDELFFNEDVISFYEGILMNWKPPHKPLALYMGCTHHKPFSKSFMHRKVIGMIESHDLQKIVQQYIVSEPLAICPRELERIYPAANYDFPPEKLTSRGRKIFIYRLRKFLLKSTEYHLYHIGFVPNHHRSILKEASEKIINPTFVPYNIYYLPKLLKRLEEIIGTVDSNGE